MNVLRALPGFLALLILTAHFLRAGEGLALLTRILHLTFEPPDSGGSLLWGVRAQYRGMRPRGSGHEGHKWAFIGSRFAVGAGRQDPRQR